jgi:hypothetical protein
MTELRTAKEIFEDLIKTLDMSVREFALSLGYERAENFYNIQREKTEFSFSILQAILRKYPDLSASFLLGESGEIYKLQTGETSVHGSEEPFARLQLKLELLEKDLVEKYRELNLLKEEIQHLQKN